MALTLESAGLVRQKTNMYNLNSFNRKSLQAFFHYWATNKGNTNLQFIPFSNSTVASDTSTGGCCTDTGWSPIAGVTSTVHVFYAKNDGTGDGTDSYVSLVNSTANTTASAFYITGLISDDNDEFLFVYPNGLIFGTDLTVSATTTLGGATESASSNAANGFVIVAA